MADQRFESTQEVLAAPLSVPEHVVTRMFEGELVALNLRSGVYHGLNGVAARMFEVLREVATPADAVEPLAAEYGQPRELIEDDLARLVRELSDRGLVILGGDGG
jgi:hypothetical protein